MPEAVKAGRVPAQLADSWFGGFGPRIGFAYSMNDKTVIRTNFARSFSQVTTTTGSTHQKGFTQTISFPNCSSGQVPTFLLKDGLPPYPVPPFISPIVPERLGYAVVARSGDRPAAGAELLEPLDSTPADQFVGARRRLQRRGRYSSCNRAC